MSRYCLGYLLAVTISAQIATSGKERIQRVYDQNQGLGTASIHSLTQDGDGFIWIGTSGGLTRFDGTDMRPWAASRLRGYITALYRGPSGEVLVLPNPNGVLYRLDGEELTPLQGPEGKPLDGIVDVAVGHDSTLWAARQTGLYRKERASAEWSAIALDLLKGERIRRIRAAADGSVLLVAQKSVWRIDPLGQFNLIFRSDAPDPQVFLADAIQAQGGHYLAAEKRPDGAHFLEVSEGKVREVFYLEANFNSFAARGKALWAALDRYLVTFRPGRTPELIGPRDGLPSGGSLLVDQEESLWVGTVDGLIQFPEPETVRWNDHDGLPGPNSRYLLRNSEGIWVSTWQGTGRLVSREGVWEGRPERLDHKGDLCMDGKGVLWTSRPRFGGRYYPLDFGQFWECGPASDGSVWLSGSRGLQRTSSATTLPEVFPQPFGDGYQPGQVMEDHRHRLWITSGETICQIELSRLNARDATAWSCETLPDTRDITSLLETSRGDIWAATNGGGVWRHDGSRWARLRNSRELPSDVILGLARSPRGGVWILGHGVKMRVDDVTDQATGWSILERLSAWQGVPGGAAVRLREEEDGSLWLTTDTGLVMVPPEARRMPSTPPAIRLVDAAVNGRRQSIGSRFEVPSGNNLLELHFASLSYRDRSFLRYQYRLHPDDEWSDSTDSSPLFRFVNLNPGRYGVEVRASLDGRNWSAAPARIVFEVPSPWYRSWWVLTLAALTIVTALLLVHRARMAIKLHLDGQRMRISMDLHDEVGSGLGSIGILADLAASETVSDAQIKNLLQKISDTATELGSALTDIVWSLRPDSGNLETLAYYLVRRAGLLFPDSCPAFETRFPENWPAVNLSFPVRRSLLLIALEALHNAAKHSGGRHVTLGIAPDGRKFRLWIADDGRGFSTDVGSDPNIGAGLLNMRRRADEIGAVFELRPEATGGTIIAVTFDPKGRQPA